MALGSTCEPSVEHLGALGTFQRLHAPGVDSFTLTFTFDDSPLTVTLVPCRLRAQAVLSSPPGATHSGPYQRQLQLACQTFAMLLTHASWPQHAQHAVTQVMAHLASNHLFSKLALLLAASESSVGDSAAQRLAQAAVQAACQPDVPQSICRHAFALLCAPQALQSGSLLAQTGAALATPVLESLRCPGHELRMQLEVLASQVCPSSSKQHALAQCAVQLLANLLHVLQASAAAPLAPAHALAFLRHSRLLLTFAPALMREAVVHSSVRSLASGANVQFDVQLSSSSQSSMQSHSAQPQDEVFSGARWYLPEAPQLNREQAAHVQRVRQRTDALPDSDRMSTDGSDVNSTAARTPDRSGTGSIHFQASLASPQLALRLAKAALSNSSSSADSSDSLLEAATEVSLWLFMLLALCSSNDVIRQQLETAQTSSALGLVQLLWASVLAPLLQNNATTSTAIADKWPEGQLAGVHKLMLPLTALCSLYSHFVSTAADDVLFSEQVCFADCRLFDCKFHNPHASRDPAHTRSFLQLYAGMSLCLEICRYVWRQYILQAPIALSELGQGSNSRARGFIPALRDALFDAFVQDSSRAKPVLLLRRAQPSAAQPESSTRAAITLVFKVLGGRLLCQLHSRAARKATVLDAWFQAPNLKHEQFRRGAAHPVAQRSLAPSASVPVKLIRLPVLHAKL